MDTNKFIIISLPVAAFEPADTDNIIDCISGYTGARHGLSTFSIPNFKIGTLDALVQQADDLTKLDAACQGVIAKVAESFRTVIGNDEERIKQYKMINDRPIDQSVPEFTWNKARYRADKPLVELIDNIQKEVATMDHQVRAKLTQYQNAKANLISLERKQTGSLATRSLTPIIDPVILVRDSDYIETHMIVIPNTAKSDFLGTYETISPMVVPRSAVEVTNDSEFTLFAVSTFKKHSHDFLLKCRENKWTPRPFQYFEGGQELERLEFDRAANEEKRLRTDLLRIARTSWVESAMIWMHIITLKIFVEAVLRYGLPLEYVSIMIQATKKTIPKITSNLVRAFSYLGGNIDKNDSDSPSRHKNDVSSIADMAALGLPSHEGHDYLPFVYYDFAFP